MRPLKPLHLLAPKIGVAVVVEGEGVEEGEEVTGGTVKRIKQAKGTTTESAATTRKWQKRVAPHNKLFYFSTSVVFLPKSILRDG